MPASLAGGDFNGDGRLDLVVANALDNPVSVLLGRGDGTFLPHVDYVTEGYRNRVTLADLYGDGFPDLVTSDNDANVVPVLLGRGATAPLARVSNTARDATPGAVVAGDFNGDGHPDLTVAGHYSSMLAILINTSQNPTGVRPVPAAGPALWART